MNDDEILAAVEGRLKQVDVNLPPSPIDPSMGPVHSPHRAAGQSIAPSTGGGLLAALLVVVAVAGVIVTRPSGASPGASPGTTDRASASLAGLSPSMAQATPTPTPPAGTPHGPTPPGYSSEIVDGLEILRGSWDGDAVLAYRMGWGPCMQAANILFRAPNTVIIDTAAAAAGIDDGWVDAPGQGLWYLASSLEEAARGLGSPIVSKGWIVLDGIGRQLVSFDTPAGRTVWRPMNSIAPTDCPLDEVPSSPSTTR
ncbi:MAG TPA: hypothetical protein VFO78_10065 [Candidatus Limnocylindrales bacterium]|nr:hypothetical protein [Candidatus Limnocylindrales bacterium]